MEEPTSPQPCRYVSGYLANADQPHELPNHMSTVYRALSRFFHGETLAERTQRKLREEECERRVFLNETQDLAKLHSRTSSAPKS